MPRVSRVVVVGGDAGENEFLASQLRSDVIEVSALPGPPEPPFDAAEADLVVINGAGPADVPEAVRTCRRSWPDRTTPVLVVNLPDPHAAAEAIEAGATDSVPDSQRNPLLTAHVRRLLRAGESMRAVLDEERRRLRRESLARAAADVAAPLGELVDQLEIAMAGEPSDAVFDELLDRVSRAVDAVDRLRGMAAGPGNPGQDDGKPHRA